MTADRTLRAACIGAGNHASWTLHPSLQYFPEVEVVAVCDLDPGRLLQASRRFGMARPYEDFRRMLSEEAPDVVICCGGPELHAAAIEAAIASQVPMFVEKPAAPTAERTRELAELADRAGARIQVGFMHRFATATQWAKRAMARTDFGRLITVYAREGLWAMDARSLVLDSGIHHIDLLCDLAGRVEWVMADRNSGAEGRHGVGVLLHFTNGVVGQLSLNSLESLSTPSDVVEIHGDGGQWIRIDNWTRATLVKDPGILFGAPGDVADSSLLWEHGWTAAGQNRSTIPQGYTDQFRHLFSCIKRAVRPHPDLWDAFRAMEIVEAIDESIRTKDRVFLPEGRQ